MSDPTRISKEAWLAITVAALGYFVDVFDIWLFANFRIPSLKALGVAGDDLTNIGALLLNCQQVGLLLGGVLWGTLADRVGRSRVMFGSIFIYSIANVANAYVTSVEMYAVLRLIAGIGLAGEIGAGVTLVSELLPTAKRGIGVTIVATVGVAGAVAAAYVGAHVDWRDGYLLGGAMGLALLVMRVLVRESSMFHRMSASDAGARRGSLKLLFETRERTMRFLRCILIGIPIWVVFGLYGIFAPEIAVALGVVEPVTVPQVLLYASIGMTAGDLVSGLLSQYLRSRRLPMLIFLLGGLTSLAVINANVFHSAESFCWLIGIFGFFVGYWICALASSAEQFGTNLRGTVATNIPNLVRASIIPISIGFVALRAPLGAATAALLIALAAYGLALIALKYMEESFSTDLDYLER